MFLISYATWWWLLLFYLSPGLLNHLFFSGTYKFIEESVDPIFTSKLKAKATYSSSVLVTIYTAAVSYLIGTGGLSPKDKMAGACRLEIIHLVPGWWRNEAVPLFSMRLHSIHRYNTFIFTWHICLHDLVTMANSIWICVGIKIDSKELLFLVYACVITKFSRWNLPPKNFIVCIVFKFMWCNNTSNTIQDISCGLINN